MKSFLRTALLLTSLGLLPHAAVGAVIEYRMLIDGEHSEKHFLSPGRHTLEVQGRVTENELAPGVPGGFIQASFDLLKSNNSAKFIVNGSCFFCPYPIWDSAAHLAFQNHLAGAIATNGDIVQETGSILPIHWNTRFGEVGADEFSFIASGPFDYDGGSTSITLSSIPEVNLVASLSGGNVGPRIPNDPGDAVIGDSVLLGIIPEPNPLILSILGFAGLNFHYPRMRSRIVPT